MEALTPYRIKPTYSWVSRRRRGGFTPRRMTENGLQVHRPICYKWSMTLTPVHGLVALLGPWRQGGEGVGPAGRERTPARQGSAGRERTLGRQRLAGRERLAAGLRSVILEGRLAVDRRLPAERTLAAAVGVRRATVT